MCNALALIGVAGSLASAGLNYANQTALMNKQQQANDAWAMQQKKYAADENARQEALRKRADLARQDTVQQMGVDPTSQAQQTEATRLNAEMQPTDTLAGDQLLSGQAQAGTEYTTNAAATLAKATQEARKRIAALATVQSYGGSQFGLQNRTNQLLDKSGNVINLIGDERKGSLGAYAAEQNIDPIRYQASPMAGLVGSIGNTIAGAAGSLAGYGAGYGAGAQYGAT